MPTASPLELEGLKLIRKVSQATNLVLGLPLPPPQPLDHPESMALNCPTLPSSLPHWASANPFKLTINQGFFKYRHFECAKYGHGDQGNCYVKDDSWDAFLLRCETCYMRTALIGLPWHQC